MSFETLYPGAANLIGNVDVPKNIHPTIRASLRRLNPDLISSAPYYASAAGKTLRLNYTKEVSTVVTPATVDITLTGNSLASVIFDINAADASNIQATDLDGFLTLKNLNPGKTHFLTITPFSTPANDAAPILGFEVNPFPGSTSYAGEIASSPGSRSQLNPQTTTLLAKDSSLDTKELNRGFVSILQMLEDLRAELSRDVVVYKDVFLSFGSHNPGPVPAARINDDSLRLFLPFPEADPPSAINPKDLAPFYRALDSAGLGEDVVNFGVGTTDANALLVTNLYYATNITNFTTSVFSVWGTPDGGTILSSVTPNKTKHPSTSITSIKGNIVTCSSATFLAHKVKAGDPVKLTASVLQPFDHSGWFAVDAVIDETHLAVRPMTSSEEIPDGTTIRPRWMNPAAGGTLLVAVGRFIPAGDIYVTINSQSLTGNHVIRIAVGVPFIQTLSADRARDLSGSLSRFGTVLNDHLSSTADRHASTDITGFTSATTWRDSTTISGANLKQTIEDILTDLKAQATGNSGTGRIGAEVITLGGGAPNTLAQGTVLTQLTALLTALQSHVNLSSGAHTATAISYAGGAAWADSTTNPATTVEGQLDKILIDLGGTGGASKIKYDGGPTWADTTTNPATTVEGQLDKIVGDLGASTGSGKIGGVAAGTDLAAGTLQVQIADLAANWLKMARVNTISAAQTFSALITANGGLVIPTGQTVNFNGTTTFITGTGQVTHGGNLSVTGASIFTGGATISSGASLVLAGTADIFHSIDWEIPIHPSEFVPNAGVGSPGIYQTYVSAAPASRNYFGRQVTTSGTSFIHAPITGLRVGDRISTVQIDAITTSGTIGSYTGTIYKNKIGSALSSIGTVSGGGVSLQEKTDSITCNYTVVSGDRLVIEISSNSTTLVIIGACVFASHP